MATHRIPIWGGPNAALDTAASFPLISTQITTSAPSVGDQLAVLLADDAQELVALPGEELALLALAVGVLGGVQPAVLAGHLAQHPLAALARDLREIRPPGDPVRLEIRGYQQRVVVEHLLEVRDPPALVGARTCRTNRIPAKNRTLQTNHENIR